MNVYTMYNIHCGMPILLPWFFLLGIYLIRKNHIKYNI